MTEHDTEQLRALFDGVTVGEVPDGRDLVGPAVAWGDRRRRRDRRLAAGAFAGAVLAVGAGVATLGPGGRTGVGPGTGVTPSATPPVITVPGAAPTSADTEHPTEELLRINRQEQDLLDSLRAFLPVGVRITCSGAPCREFKMTGPAGTSVMQWGTGTDFIRSAVNDAVYEHDHKPTAAIPLTSGPFSFPGGTVTVRVTDIEAQSNFPANLLADPAAVLYNMTQYAYTPANSATGYHIALSEMIQDVPWKTGTVVDSHQRDDAGYSPTGPVMAPAQFASLVGESSFQTVFGQLKLLDDQALALQTRPPSQPTH